MESVGYRGGSRGDNGDRQGGSMLKEAIGRRNFNAMKRGQANYLRYLDSMQESLNKNIQENVFPYWRNHNSLKGWSAMNYPATVTNPLLKKHEPKEKRTEQKLFSNTERPISCPTVVLQRPFSSTLQSGLKFQPTKAFQKAGLEVGKGVDENQKSLAQFSEITGAGISNSDFAKQSMCSTHFGKSIKNSNFRDVPKSAIATVDKIVSDMPIPKKALLARKKKDLEAKKAALAAAAEAEAEALGSPADGEEVVKKVSPKKKKAVAPKKGLGMPEVVPLPPPQPLKVDDALSQAVSWSHANNIAKKFSVGTLTTSNYHVKCSNFKKMNENAAEKSSLFPQSNYFGPTPDPARDPYDRRVIRQLNDIDFDEDSDDAEEIRNLKRMPQTVLNEENLKNYLTQETEKLCLENHYWLSNQFLEKAGRMAPCLRELSLRRMKFINNVTFAEIFKYLKQLEKVDLTDCELIENSALKLLVRQNQNLTHLQISGCKNGVDDSVLQIIAKQQKHLNFLDMSYAVKVTDKGMSYFKDVKSPIYTLVVNGLTGVSSKGLSQLIYSCRDTLIDFEGAVMNQETMKSDLFVGLAQCFNLESLDIQGNTFIEDNAINMLAKAQLPEPAKDEPPSVHPGYQYLHTVKMSQVNMSDTGIINLFKLAPHIEHLELTKCERVTEFGINSVLDKENNLTFLDLNFIPAFTYMILDELRNKHPNLLMRRFRENDVDKKDNGLRVPRRVIEKKKKKKKGRKGKKKK